MWHVARGSWQWIHQVAVGLPARLQRDKWLWDDMPLNSPKLRHIGILLLVSISAISPESTYHSAPICEIFIEIGPPSAEKNDVMSIFKMANLRQVGFSNNGFFEKPLYDFYRSSILENMALNFSFWKKSRFCFLATDKQTDRWTDGQARCMKPLSLSRAAAY